MLAHSSCYLFPGNSKSLFYTFSYLENSAYWSLRCHTFFLLKSEHFLSFSSEFVINHVNHKSNCSIPRIPGTCQIQQIFYHAWHSIAVPILVSHIESCCFFKNIYSKFPIWSWIAIIYNIDATSNCLTLQNFSFLLVFSCCSLFSHV